jgi:hypothetical protein
MSASTGRRLGIPALAVLLLVAVAVDIARRAVGVAEPRPPGATPAAASRRTGGSTGPGSDAASRPGESAAVTERLEPAARAAVLERVATEGAGTYLGAMLEGGDSALHRWPDDRRARPLRVGVARGSVPGFREAFVGNVAWAVARWNAVGLPVWLDDTPDTAGADIVITWVDRLDGDRTGRTDLTWQRRGPIIHVHIALATHTPDGGAVLPTQMVALALHEIGHALGLGHSPLATDALYPRTSATDLSPRDRRTATLLYALPPGSLK